MGGLDCWIICKSLFIFLTTKKTKFFIFGNKPFLLPAYAAVICAVVSIKFPEVTGIGADVIDDLLNFKIDLTSAIIF